MNLTAIPEAVTQPCQLQQLWLDFNHLFGMCLQKSYGLIGVDF
jgi:hypothetical protein